MQNYQKNNVRSFIIDLTRTYDIDRINKDALNRFQRRFGVELTEEALFALTSRAYHSKNIIHIVECNSLSFSVFKTQWNGKVFYMLYHIPTNTIFTFWKIGMESRLKLIFNYEKYIKKYFIYEKSKRKTKNEIKLQLHSKSPFCGLCRIHIKVEDLDMCNIDHIIPRSRGGTNNIDNLQISHVVCNRLKGNADPSVISSTLMKKEYLKKLNNKPKGEIMKRPNSFVRTQEAKAAYKYLEMIMEDRIDYNYFYLKGNVGSGKSILLSYAVDELKENNPNLNIQRISATDFTKEMILSIQTQMISSFSKKYKEADLIIFEEVFDLKDRSRTQTELIEVIEENRNTNQKIIFTSSEDLNEVSGIQNRLFSFIQGAVQINLLSPSIESKELIVKEIADRRGLFLEEDVVRYIVDNTGTNIRGLIGKIIKLEASSDLFNKDINLEFAKEQLMFGK